MPSTIVMLLRNQTIHCRECQITSAWRMAKQPAPAWSLLARLISCQMLHTHLATFLAGESAPASGETTFCGVADTVRIGSTANAAEGQAMAIVAATERLSGFLLAELMILYVTDVGDGSLG